VAGSKLLGRSFHYSSWSLLYTPVRVDGGYLVTMCVHSWVYQRKVEIVNYFSNQEIESQEIHDPELFQIVAWDRAHKGKLTPMERWKILTNEVMLKRALVLWENETTPMPKRATEHVALQVRRRDLRAPKKSLMCPIGWSLIGVALIVGVVVVGVNL
jgi:hypothetical protein